MGKVLFAGMVLLAATLSFAAPKAAVSKTVAPTMEGIWACATSTGADAMNILFLADSTAKAVSGSDTMMVKYHFDAKAQPKQLDLILGNDTLIAIADFPNADSLIWVTNQASPKERPTAIPKEVSSDFQFCKRQK